jgi:hypothetical protein
MVRSVGVVAGHRLCISYQLMECWFLCFFYLYTPSINGVASPYSLLSRHEDGDFVHNFLVWAT